MAYKAINNAYATLAVAMATTDTIAQVATGKGDLFPVITGTDHTYITLENSAGAIEIVKVTARALGSDSMTVVRGQDGTSAKSWLVGDIVECRPCAAMVTDLQAEFAAADAAQAVAAAISVTPVGNIASTNVQAALAELDTEKQPAGSYAALAGLATQVFSVANAATANNAINLGQGDARYAPIAYTQFGGQITVDTAISASDSGKFFHLATGTATLPAPVDGLRFRFIGEGQALPNGTLAAPAGVGMGYPDGAAATAGTIAVGKYTTVDVEAAGGSWYITNTSGQVLTKAATASNHAVNFGQAIPITSPNVTPLPGVAGLMSITHSLGVVPLFAMLQIVCLVAEYGYSIGDVINTPTQINGSFIYPIAPFLTATTIQFQINTGYNLRIDPKAGGSSVTPTAANWAWRIVYR